ncbi:hypothetical protein BDZ94DRAFT_1308629 [Collybia nuda]|uniref:Uncharacterized protein n=1 Tax=Collybia nuda TaxID=64659 RepID=A0A9P6CFA6_9AGAR|nr:hypothetical protein BDZ94DRAFT_1308629 [Collybia nuda]
MSEPPINVYYTHPFSAAGKRHLESLFSNISEWKTFNYILYNEAHNGLSPLQLFQHLGRTWSDRQYAVIVDQRTATEIGTSASLTAAVAASWQITLNDEWDLYRGSQDLESMPEGERNTFLRGLAEQRANREAQESGGEEWFWEPNSEQKGVEAILWQVKSVRADLSGVDYISSVYDVKDIRDMHLHFKLSADNNNGVFSAPHT